VPGAGQASSAGFDVYAYDNYGGASATRIIPRAIVLLDYTPGGSDFNPTAAALDIGGADVIHGEVGDDTIYGEVGNDVLYGDGQNAVIIGGYGADWISGGTGEDGILGDDGRLFVSRIGTAEPLYGIPVTPNQNTEVSFQGGMQDVMTNVTATLLYTAMLTPDNLDASSVGSTNPNELFVPLNANDIIYGGLGNDSIHGGAGDDAISGEAPAISYTDVYAINAAQTRVKLNTAPIEATTASVPPATRSATARRSPIRRSTTRTIRSVRSR
jgi:Ca2+-binding RTX toxin-like protein